MSRLLVNVHQYQLVLLDIAAEKHVDRVNVESDVNKVRWNAHIPSLSVLSLMALVVFQISDLFQIDRQVVLVVDLIDCIRFLQDILLSTSFWLENLGSLIRNSNRLSGNFNLFFSHRSLWSCVLNGDDLELLLFLIKQESS